jgi:hypothetical protein
VGAHPERPESVFPFRSASAVPLENRSGHTTSGGGGATEARASPVGRGVLDDGAPQDFDIRLQLSGKMTRMIRWGRR